MNDKDKFSIKPATSSKRVPAPTPPGFPFPSDGPGPLARPGVQNLPPEAVSGMFRCGEIILKARARCAEIQAMTEQEIRRLDKEIEKCTTETDNRIRLLEEQGKQKDFALQRFMTFEAVLEERHYSDAVKIALIEAFRDTLK